jgi:prevent-host-death family protein
MATTPKPVPIHEAKAHLSKLIERARAGETIIIARGKRPMVKLVPVEARIGRRFGAMRGRARVSEAFFDALPEEELDPWCS